MSIGAGDRWPLTGRHAQLDGLVEQLADPSCRGLVLGGPAGVGKSRLAAELVARAEARGRSVRRAIANRSAAAVPLGAIAHLLPPDLGLGDDPVAMLGQARRAFESEQREPPILLVDDAHLLDGVSLTLVGQLVAGGTVCLVATLRSGEQIPDGLSSLWRTGDVRRTDLEPLARADVDTLLHLALGGPLEGQATITLWDASQGNPLFLHELVAGALASGSLREAGGVWELVGPISTGRLAEVLADRLLGVSAAARAVLELIALCEPLAVADLDGAVAAEVLEDLEADGLLAVAVTADGHEVRVAHPLYAEILRAEVPQLRKRRLLEQQADAVTRRGVLGRDDTLRVARWRLDAGLPADADLLERAALLARHAHDFDLVERLAAAALQARPSAAAALLLGEACYELGDFERAEAVLASADGLAETDIERVRLASTRQTNLFWGLLRPDDALAVIHATLAQVSSDGARASLLSAEASTTMYNGRPDQALGLLERLDALGSGDARARVLRAIPEAPALALAGRTADAVAVADRGFAEHLELAEEIAIAHPGTHLVTKVLALAEAGRLAEGVSLAEDGYRITVTDRSRIGQIWFALNLCRLGLLQGRPATAERWAREACAVARRAHFDGPLRLALNALSVAVAWQGQAALAASLVAEADALPGDFGLLFPERQLGRAWAAVADGRPVEAREGLLVAARDAADTGHVTIATWLLHDAARLGERGTTAPAMADLAARCDSALVAARAAHVDALERGDAPALVAASQAFEALGANLVAAEAAITAADALRRDGDQRAAAGQAARAEALRQVCEGAVTPGLVAGQSVVPLTDREREVALLAASGVASKDIADRLYLSVRTVNNHLQHSYTKLGVASRTELAAALGIAEG